MTKNIKLLYLYIFFTYFRISGPIAILFFVQISGSYALATLIFSLQYVFCLLLELPTGCLSDKIGKKQVSIAGALSLLIAFCFYGFAVNYTMLVIGAFFRGLYMALSSGNNDALLYESAVESGEKENFQKIFGRYKSTLQASLGFGNLFGIIFAFISLRAVMIAAIVPLIPALIVTFFLKEPKHAYSNNEKPLRHIQNSWRCLLSNKKLFYTAIGKALNNGFNEAAFAFNSAFFQQFVPVWSLGIFRSTGHFLGSLGNHLSYYFTQKSSIETTAIWWTGMSSVVNILSVLANSILSPFLKLLSSFVNSVKDPAMNTIVQNECLDDKRVTTTSIISLFEGCFYAAGALLIGYIADLSSPYWAMLTAYLFCLTGNLFLVIGLRKY